MVEEDQFERGNRIIHEQGPFKEINKSCFVSSIKRRQPVKFDVITPCGFGE